MNILMHEEMLFRGDCGRHYATGEARENLFKKISEALN